MAHRVGYRCAKPDCGILTRGATSNDDGTINVGFAAHITAASPDGPRYDPTLTSEQRKNHSNGIWLCGTHAKLVDSDEGHFTVEKLVKWKRLAERRSFIEVTSSKPSPTGAALADDENVQSAFDLLQDYSKSDLSAFQGVSEWPSHAIELNLRLVDGDSAKAFTVSGLASGIDVFDQVAVIAPPGTGKTTTLLQLAEATLANTASVAVFIPLSEWATGSDTFFQSLLKRDAFRHARERQFELLARHGKVVLILDGWNELDDTSRRRVRNEVKSLRRDFPEIRLVISSRHKDSEIPIDGPVVEVELLNEDQQLDLAKGLRSSDGESLMDHAWRTPGLNELVAIPLYLTSLLKLAPGGSLPTTKEELLRSFVEELEQDRDKMATLRETLQGFHREFLEEIAVEATHHGTVALSEKQARAATNDVLGRLKAENQIAETDPLQPMRVLDVLASSHMLVRAGIETGSVLFQHQQFQEWFASFYVQQLMLSAASCDDDAKKRLRERVLDIPVWEEAVLFACDRLSRADQNGAKAVAHAIIDTLGIDPFLSAEMIWRSSDVVWEQIRGDVISFAVKWHTPGRVDRAVNFMNDTGHAEFSEYIWPLISNPDAMLHLHALREGKRFRPSVLGSDVEKLIAALPDEVRKNVLSEIASNSGMDGIELATSLAKNDTSPKVKESVIGALVFRRADRFANEILESAPDEVWQSLARNWHAREFSDPDVSARMQKEADKFFNEETDPGKILDTLLRSEVGEPVLGQKVHELVERIDFSDEGKENRWVIQRAYELYPVDVVTGLFSLLEQGKQLPFQANEMLRLSDIVIDHGPLVDCVLNNSAEGRIVEAAACVVGAKTIGQLIDQMSSQHTCIPFSDEYNRLEDLISSTKVNAFAQAVLERASTDRPDDIHILAKLISQHGKGFEREHLRLDTLMYHKMTASVQRWGEVLLTSYETTRAQFAGIAKAAERLEAPELVPVLLKLLSEDLARKKHDNSHICWTIQYRNAFAAIGDERTVDAMKPYLPDPEFGFDAAHVLKEVWLKSQPKKDESGLMRSWPDFSVVPDAYKKRQSGTAEETHPLVEEIIAVIDDLTKPGANAADLNHALKLSTVAFSMPYADKGEIITTLLNLPASVNKRGLLTTLVLSGEVISSDIVLQGFDEDAKENPWMLHDQDGWLLKQWLNLLPFTERPAAALELLDRVESFVINPWKLSELLLALAYAPSTEADTVLDELAKRDVRFLSEYNWLTALGKRDTLSAAKIFLDLICNASLTEIEGRLNHTDLGRKLSTFMVSHDQFRKDVYEQFQTLDDGPTKFILEYAIAEAADAEGVLLITREGAVRDKHLRSTTLYTALQKMLIGQRPVESSRMQQLYNLPVPELRKTFFDMVVNGNASESRLATECLNAIDEIRNNFDLVDAEPRHPDIATGVPWPIVGLTEKQFRQSLKVFARGKPEELQKQEAIGIALAKVADDIFNLNIPVFPGVVGVNLNNAIRHLGDLWKKLTK